MALIIIVQHVILTVVFHSMTSHATSVSRTFKMKTNSTGSPVCAVDKPSNVIPMAASTMSGQCGLQCNVAPGCQLFQFKNDSAHCELYHYSPSNFSTIDHCMAYGAPPVNVALGRPAYQQSNYQEQFASLAVDGTIQSSCTWNQYSHPWWAVDIGQPAIIVAVNVVNDNNVGFVYRLDNFIVGLSNTQPIVMPIPNPMTTSNYTLCNQYVGSVPAGAAALVKCSATIMQFQYVIVQSSLTDALCLTEVEVFVG